MQLADVWDEFTARLPGMYQSYRRRITSLAVSTKADSTLLSEADVAVQEFLVSALAEADQDAGVIAEESGLDHLRGGLPRRIWIVDPIDGTREFLSPSGVEFCTVVCLLEDRQPIGVFVLAPELGPDRTPVCIRMDGPGERVLVNGAVVGAPASPQHASITRESRAAERPWEAAVAGAYGTKTRTTSQTLDLVRTSVDVGRFTAGRLPGFALFYRERQKIWDGAAGLALATASGLSAVDRQGESLLPFAAEKLSDCEPTLNSSLVAPPATAQWMVELLNN